VTSWRPRGNGIVERSFPAAISQGRADDVASGAGLLREQMVSGDELGFPVIVAVLDRQAERLGLPSEGKGHTFESCRVRQCSQLFSASTNSTVFVWVAQG
jgi:hypothetical protein